MAMIARKIEQKLNIDADRRRWSKAEAAILGALNTASTTLTLAIRPSAQFPPMPPSSTLK